MRRSSAIHAAIVLGNASHQGRIVIITATAFGDERKHIETHSYQQFDSYVYSQSWPNLRSYANNGDQDWTLIAPNRV